MNNNQNEYVPEYNPKKYKRASEIAKIVSLVLLGLMFASIACICATAFLFNPDAYRCEVNGVEQFDTDFFVMILSLPICGFGLMSLFVGVLYSRLKQANTIIAEPDAEKRLEGHLKFQKQADAARVIATAHTINELGKKD